ncbi:MAG TPA: FRG domain-containing protein [Longimicrobium sp.]|nr:FRG domain-containing protein [Longimicrobium sp.]
MSSVPVPRSVRVAVDHWTSARELLGRLRRYIYRGQANSSWVLETSLERDAERLNASEWLVVAENQMLQAFQRRAHHYLSTLPEISDTLSWLALIQHYGGPTRLLDFTRSPYVAAFFALEHAREDAAVWAINETALLEQNAKVLETGTAETQLVVDPACLDLANQALNSKADERGVLLVEPFRLDDRISKQQGCFLVPLDLKHSFEGNLESNFGPGSLKFDGPSTFMYKGGNSYFFADPPPILKIVLPRRFHPDAMLDLEAMNVNSASLFGGLDGFARSLPSILRRFERRHYERQELREMFERPQGY